MRILYFSRSFTIHDLRFLEKLAGSRHEIWFLPLHDDPEGWYDADIPVGVELVSWPRKKEGLKEWEALLGIVPVFEEVLNKVEPLLVHAGPIQTCGFITALAGFHPLLAMSWGSDMLVDADRDETWRWITRFTLGHADVFMCDNDVVKKKAEELTPSGFNRIIQIPWGTDIEYFSPADGRSELRSQLGWENETVLLTTRSWEPIYGPDILIDAFREAYAENPNLRLLMLGDGSLRSKLVQRITEYGISGVIKCPGVVSNENLPRYFQSADVYISCSYSDGTSVSLLEAMASGLPIIVTDVESNREWVVDGENGWLAEGGNAHSFARAISRATNFNVRQLHKMKLRNRKLVEERANWDTNFTILLEAYDWIENYIAD